MRSALSSWECWGVEMAECWILFGWARGPRDRTPDTGHLSLFKSNYRWNAYWHISWGVSWEMSPFPCTTLEVADMHAEPDKFVCIHFVFLARPEMIILTGAYCRAEYGICMESCDGSWSFEINLRSNSKFSMLSMSDPPHSSSFDWLGAKIKNMEF